MSKKKKIIKLHSLIMLIFLLVFNTYAWFVFVTRASVSFTAHVSSWNVNFTQEGGEASSEIFININKIFPGMMPFEKIIEVTNNGEVEATLEYEIESLKILNQTFTVGRGITEEELRNKINTEYPFKFSVEIEDLQVIEGQHGTGRFNFKMEWPFESGDDAKDTLWGTKAYEYYESNPSANSIELVIKLIARQKNGTN